MTRRSLSDSVAYITGTWQPGATTWTGEFWVLAPEQPQSVVKVTSRAGEQLQINDVLFFTAVGEPLRWALSARDREVFSCDAKNAIEAWLRKHDHI